MAGRKRAQNRERYSNGRPKQLEGGLSPTEVKRIIAWAAREARGSFLGTSVGRLRLESVIADAEVSAAWEYGAIVGQFDRLKGLPARVAKSPSYEIGFGRATSKEPEESEVRKVEAKYDACRKALGFLCGLVTDLVVYDKDLEVWEDRIKARMGLQILAQHFGLTA